MQTLLPNNTLTLVAGDTVVITLSQSPALVGRVLLGAGPTPLGPSSAWTGSIKPQKRVAGSHQPFADCWWTDAMSNTAHNPGDTLTVSGAIDTYCDGCELQYVITVGSGSLDITPVQLAG